jgi:alpha-1,2-mannosyltransferase
VNHTAGQSRFDIRQLIRLSWLIGVAFALALFVRDFLTFQYSRGISINGSALWGRDFVNVYSAGRLIIEDRLATVYDVAGYQAWQTAVFGWGINDHIYSYPPVTLLYAPLFGALPYFVSLALWTGASLGLFYWAAKPWLEREGLNPLLSLVLPTTILCMWAGHYGLIFGALWLGAWHFMERRPAVSGVLTGLMIIKPHLAILMPLMMLRRQAWIAIGVAALTVMALIALSILIFGVEVWQIYLTTTSQGQFKLIGAVNTFFIKMMPTISPALFKYGFAANAVWAVQAVAGLLTVLALWFRQPIDNHRAGLAAAVGTFLVLPYAFNYDMTLIGLAALLMMNNWTTTGRNWPVALATFLFVLPTTLFFFNRAGLWITPIVLAASLFVLLQREEGERA